MKSREVGASIGTGLHDCLKPCRGTRKDDLARYAAMFERARHLKRVTHDFLQILMIPRFIHIAATSESPC